MRAIIIFHSKAGRTRSVAEAIAAGLKEKGFETDFAQLEIVEKKKTKAKNKEQKKKPEEAELMPAIMDVSPYDIIVFGTPVYGLSPKRKISKAIEAYLRKCNGIEGKKAAVFLTCFGIPGTAMKKISAMLQTRGAGIAESLVVAYLLGISNKQLDEAKEFGKRIAFPQ